MLRGGSLCRFHPRSGHREETGPKILQFPPTIHFIYNWVDKEMLGTRSQVTCEFLRSLREENLITQEGQYEEDYTLKVPNVNERVCYINHESRPNWMWIYNVLISKFGI